MVVARDDSHRTSRGTLFVCGRIRVGDTALYLLAERVTGSDNECRGVRDDERGDEASRGIFRRG